MDIYVDILLFDVNVNVIFNIEFTAFDKIIKFINFYKFH
jgi:hypothetical protein